jgi:5-methylcytosine-specific restriction protein A
VARNPHQEWYGSMRWRKRAARQLREHPLCAICEAQGLVVAAREVDHIERHGGDYRRFFEGEIQSLCRVHHEQKTAEEEGHKRRGGYSKEIGLDGYPVDVDRHPFYHPREWAASQVQAKRPVKRRG